MSILNREEFFARLEDRIKGDATDEAIKFLEDMSDTYNDMERKINTTNNEEWERKYKELDDSWKKRYRHRFFSGDYRMPPSETVETDEVEAYKPEEITIDKLFEKKEDF